MARRLHPFPWLLSVFMVGCSGPGLNLPEIGERLPDEVREVIEGAQSLDLLVLHPYPDVEGGAPTGAEDDFHGYRVLGSATLTSEEDRRELLTLFYRGLLDSDGLRASCFRPRHGIRARLDERKVDVAICFECLWLRAFGPASDAEERVILTGEGVRGEFNALCRRFGLTPHP